MGSNSDLGISKLSRIIWEFWTWPGSYWGAGLGPSQIQMTMIFFIHTPLVSLSSYVGETLWYLSKHSITETKFNIKFLPKYWSGAQFCQFCSLWWITEGPGRPTKELSLKTWPLYTWRTLPCAWSRSWDSFPMKPVTVGWIQLMYELTAASDKCRMLSKWMEFHKSWFLGSLFIFTVG